MSGSAAITPANAVTLCTRGEVQEAAGGDCRTNKRQNSPIKIISFRPAVKGQGQE